MKTTNGIIAEIILQWNRHEKRTKKATIDSLGNVQLTFDDDTTIAGPAQSKGGSIDQQIAEANAWLQSSAPWLPIKV